MYALYVYTVQCVLNCILCTIQILVYCRLYNISCTLCNHIQYALDIQYILYTV